MNAPVLYVLLEMFQFSNLNTFHSRGGRTLFPSWIATLFFFFLTSWDGGLMNLDIILSKGQELHPCRERFAGTSRHKGWQGLPGPADRRCEIAWEQQPHNSWLASSCRPPHSASFQRPVRQTDPPSTQSPGTRWPLELWKSITYRSLNKHRRVNNPRPAPVSCFSAKWCFKCFLLFRFFKMNFILVGHGRQHRVLLRYLIWQIQPIQKLCVC